MKLLKIRTRFAPSPTGELHIGGARTALYNYLLAKKNNGVFVFRNEDTDIQRNKEQFIKEHYDDLRWLGMEINESIFDSGPFGPYRQTQRLNFYNTYSEQLLKKNLAYKCFCTEEDIGKEREEYKEKNKSEDYKYSKKCLFLSKEEVNKLTKINSNFVIRLNIPQEKEYSFNDIVRGKVSFLGKNIEDFIIIKSNGIPSYNFSCVVDDYLMQITHVLRGEEHLTNTGKQLVLYDFFGWEQPEFGHISVILGKNKKKLSKRDNDGVENFAQTIKKLKNLGYLSESVINYLLLLGWHPGSTKELFSSEEMIKFFDLRGLNSSGAVYDIEKLNWYNNKYIQKLDDESYKEKSLFFLTKKYKIRDCDEEKTFEISMLFKKQLNNFDELIDLVSFFFSEELFNVELKRKEEIKKLFNIFLSLDDWCETNIKNSIMSLLTKTENKKELFLEIRKCLTGSDKGPELNKIISLLGKKKTLCRLNHCLINQ